MFPKTEITRSFNTPRELLFKAFTESEHLQNWWGPKGWTFDISKFEPRHDGVFHYSQTSPDGNVMWVKFVYHEVNAPEKLVYTSFFSDEKGNIVRAPFNDNWPLETLNTFTFTEHEGKTLLSMIGTPVSPTEEEMKTYEESQEMVQEGFSGTFVQLADYLSNISYN
ncbi:SRPBCC domain-containing protein [Peribacillus sp. NPDC096622]|uniref:SRPBCC family protein n=1 Tax=Peribacillus sp. NPDC096622 TaxID=3364396 RepID=UPI0026FD0BD1|nr:SRPBCC domain-containing protein [Peribacillus frigoritolerans]